MRGLCSPPPANETEPAQTQHTRRSHALSSQFTPRLFSMANQGGKLPFMLGLGGRVSASPQTRHGMCRAALPWLGHEQQGDQLAGVESCSVPFAVTSDTGVLCLRAVAAAVPGAL